MTLLAGIASADSFAQVSRALLEDRSRERLERCLAGVNSIEGLRLRLAAALDVPESLDEAEVLAEGCVLIFDEFFNYHGYQLHEFKAFHEFLAETGAAPDYLAFSGQQISVRLSLPG